MKSNLNNLLTSLMNTGKSSHNNNADHIRGISDEITNELVFDKEHQVKSKSYSNLLKENLKESTSKQNSSDSKNKSEKNKQKNDENQVADKWTELKKVGSGLQNQGNTCFLNSTLQCLIYSRPFFNHLLSVKHSHTCMNGKLCMVCELKSLAKACLLQNNHVVSPVSILKKLKQIARHMRWGSQEDAHEFLRHVIDALHRCSLNKNSPSPSKKSSPIIKLFGGILKSQIVCMQCNMESIKLDPFMDVSLEVRGVPSIEAGLARFTKPEFLDGDNAYLCKNCKRKVRAKKRFLFYKLPEILTIQFKRYSMGGGKVSNHISFPSTLNLQPFTENAQNLTKSGYENDNHENAVINKNQNSSKNHLSINHTSSKNNHNNLTNSNYTTINHTAKPLTSFNHSSNNLSPSRPTTKASAYQLYGVLVHEGSSTSSGHYYSYVKGPNDAWFCMNDSHVFQTSLNHVLKAQAYLLFYHRIHHKTTTPNSKPFHSEDKKTPGTSPSVPKIVSNTFVPNPISPSSFLSLKTNGSTTKSPNHSKPLTLNINDVINKKNKPIKQPTKTESTSSDSLTLKSSKLDYLKSESLKSVLLKSDFEDSKPLKSIEKLIANPLNCQLSVVKSINMAGKNKEMSLSLALQSDTKIRGGEVKNGVEGSKEGRKEESTFFNYNSSRNHAQHCDTVKFTSIWKIKPFVIKSSSFNGCEGDLNRVNVGDSCKVGDSGDWIADRQSNGVKDVLKGAVRRSSSGVWKVEKMGMNGASSVEKIKKVNGVCEMDARVKEINGFRKNDLSGDVGKPVKESHEKVLQNRGEDGLFFNKKKEKSSNKNQHLKLKIESGDSSNEENGDMIRQKQDIVIRKPLVHCATYKWDSRGQIGGNKKENEMKRKKMTIESLTSSTFSIPLVKWDGVEDEMDGGEEERKKRDFENKRKRKYEEMDEEIDQGRVKKIKSKKLSTPNLVFNPFQVCQNKNYKKLRENTGSLNFSF